MHVSQLNIYPVKSMAGVSLKSRGLLKAGLDGDRRFMVVKPSGKFVTGRTHPQITQISPSFDGELLTLSHAQAGEISLHVAELQNEYRQTDVWRTVLLGQNCPPAIDAYLSDILREEVHLLYFGSKSKRLVTGIEGTEVGFADAYPLLIIGEGSLTDLNARLANPVTMANFRPNIVVAGTAPYEEDNWKRLSINGVELDVTSPCSRCIFTTVNPKTGARDMGPDPLKTLSSYRKTDEGIMFGQNAMPLTTGTFSLGDEINVLETCAAPMFKT